ncbi:MAG: biotin--[acetyl-CoA-carboxylase] ligase [Methylococcales bacterium]
MKSASDCRLGRALELLDESVIRSSLKDEVIERVGAFYIHHRIDSTNHFLSSVSPGPGFNGAICLAESQTAGEGRNGRRWISPFGKNVYLSLGWQYPGGSASVSGLSLAVGVAVARALFALGITGLGLKWPNDILWNGKKLGGILIELWGEVQGPCSVVVGLGLNYAMSPAEGAEIEQEWVDLDTATDRSKPGRNRLVASLINEILPAVAGFDHTGLAPFLSEWRALDCMQGKHAVLHMAGREIPGIVAGISAEGLIQLYQSNRELRSYASGEVSFHPGRD